MKVVLKSERLDLEVDSVEKLDDVLVFVEKFFELERKAEQADREAQTALSGRERKERRKQG